MKHIHPLQTSYNLFQEICTEQFQDNNRGILFPIGWYKGFTRLADYVYLQKQKWQPFYGIGSFSIKYMLLPHKCKTMEMIFNNKAFTILKNIDRHRNQTLVAEIFHHHDL